MAAAATEDIDISAVWSAIRRNLARLALLSLLAGALTYAVAEIVTNAWAWSVPAFSKKPAIAGFTSFATFLLGLAWTAMMALVRGARLIEPVAKTGEVGSARAAVSSLRIEPRVGPQPTPAIAAAAVVTATAAPAPVIALSRFDAANGRSTSIAALARAIIADAKGPAGYRTLVTADAPHIDVVADAMELVSAIAKAGKAAILVDWCPEGGGYASLTQTPGAPGLCELLAGKVSFQDVVKRVPHSEAHVIVTGELAAGGSVAFDADRINLVLDALDEAYEHIVVSGRHEPGKVLFETIEGRFDAGVLVGPPEAPWSIPADGIDKFLGFEVTDISIMYLDRAVRAPVVERKGLRGIGGFSIAAAYDGKW